MKTETYFKSVGSRPNLRETIHAGRGFGRARREGVALVITLIMLSVVTIMAVAFLAMSRRERGSVTASSELVEAKYFAEAAAARARADVASRFLATGTPAINCFLISTNYYRPEGLDASLTGLNAVYNVAFSNLNNTPLSRPQAETVLGNLYFSPRAPVYVRTNLAQVTPPESRFFLDLNRNGFFEPTTNRVEPVLDPEGRSIPTEDRSDILRATNCVVGDPQWVGVLERPDQPHSSSNRFIGRMAYLVVPSGRTFDLNTIHNHARSSVNLNLDGYNRNQGVGAWELNLGAFFRELDTNVWTRYIFNESTSSSNGSAGQDNRNPEAYFDANLVRRYRERGRGTVQLAPIPSLQEMLGGTRFGPTQMTAFDLNAYLDLYSDDDPRDVYSTPVQPNDRTRTDDGAKLAWSGGDRPVAFNDVFELFEVDAGLADRLRGVKPNSVAGNSPVGVDYTFYKLLSSLSTDTPDGRFYYQPNVDGSLTRRPKLHLNFAQNSSGEIQAMRTNGANLELRRWEAQEWFNEAADRMIRREFTFNGYGFSLTNIPVRYIGNTVSSDGRGNRFTNVVTHQYDAQMHRLLQLAVNIYDASQTNRYPTVFRPRFYRSETNVWAPNRSGDLVQWPVTNIYIGGYTMVTNVNPGTGRLNPLTFPWVDLDAPHGNVFYPNVLNHLTLDSRMARTPTANTNASDVNIYGVPWVIGAKRGFPNFNQAFWQTAMTVTRRVQVVKNAQAAVHDRTPNAFGTNVQYSIELKREAILEAWNSYARNYTNNHRVILTNDTLLAVAQGTNLNQLVALEGLTPAGFAVPVLTNRFAPGPRGFTVWTNRTFGDSSFRIYQPQIAATNRFVYIPGNVTSVEGFRRSSNTLVQVIPSTNMNQLYFPLTPGTPLNVHPNLSVMMTNRLIYALEDVDSTGVRRIVDFVNLKSSVIESNILERFAEPQLANDRPFLINDQNDRRPFQPGHLWVTNRLNANSRVTRGIQNQMIASAITNDTRTTAIYRNAQGDRSILGRNGARPITQKRKEALKMRWFLYRDPEFLNYGDDVEIRSLVGTAIDATRTILVTDRRAANDPLVHYTLDDLRPGGSWFVADFDGPPGVPSQISGGYGRMTFGGSMDKDFVLPQAGVPLESRKPKIYAPWNQAQILSVDNQDATARNPGIKDPGIASSDDWNFPNHQYPSVGWLGRVHRGTPWQTVYLKSGVVDFGYTTLNALTAEGPVRRTALQFRRLSAAPIDRQERVLDQGVTQPSGAWPVWSGHYYTHPVGDWALMDLFTTAMTETAARGLLSPNQDQPAAWAAALGELPVIDNTGSSAQLARVRPATRSFKYIVDSINAARALTGTGRFESVAEVFASPGLSLQSPYLARGYVNSVNPGANADAVVERIPQQLLSLMREDHPHYTVYAFGQALKPAPGSLITRPGPTFGLCTNYQVMGEYATKTVFRLERTATNIITRVERFESLSPQ